MRASTHIAIANVVVERGGNSDDVRDLIDVWRRVERDTSDKADRIRAEARKTGAAFLAATRESLG